MEKLFYGGSIITMTGESPEALLVRDGLIAATGGRAELSAMSSGKAEAVDLKGQCLMPAFIDGHSHLSQYALSFTAADLSGCKCFDEIIETLKRFKAENKLTPGEPVSGFGYDQNSLAEGRHPDRFLLDREFPENPVVLSHISGHVGVVSSAILEMLGFNENTVIPGGSIGKTDDGRLSGYLEENAFFILRQNSPPPSVEKSLGLLQKAQQVYLSCGITTAQDGMLDEGSFALLKAASQRHQLICDVVGYGDMKVCPELLRENEEYTRGQYINHFRLGGYKIFLDGSPQGRTAWMSEPYLKTPADSREGYCGFPIYTDEELRGFTERAVAEGRQLLAHCNGDAAARQFVRAYSSPTDTRPVVIHAQFMPVELLPELREKGLMPSYFIAHTYYWGDAHIENMGMDRAENISPAGSTLRAGVPFTFHQDTPVIPPNMIESLWCAVNRETKNGVQLNKGEALDVYEALKAVTVNAAYQYFEEDRKGTLEKGKLADMVILSENPLELPGEDLRRIQVMATYKEGQQVFARE